MKHIAILATLILLLPISIYAQTGAVSVTGRIVEKETKEPIAQALVELLLEKDSTRINHAVSSDKGHFKIEKVKRGNYLVKVSSLGLVTKYIKLVVDKNSKDINLGYITMKLDEVMLKEVVIKAKPPKVVVNGDTLEYNAAAYNIEAGEMLKELVKKIPGIKISRQGGVTLNGKPVSQLLIDGKSFFGMDIAKGLENIPVDIINKVKAYEKGSEEEEITGIPDSQRATVLDVVTKEGVTGGMFSNAKAGIGTKDKYTSKLSINRFTDKYNLSLAAKSNNVNESDLFERLAPSFVFIPNLGAIRTTSSVGVNYNYGSEKINVDGSSSFNWSKNESLSKNYTERFLKEGNSYSNSINESFNKDKSFNNDLRVNWKMTKTITANMSYNFSVGGNTSNSQSKNATYDGNPYSSVSEPMDYLDLNEIDKTNYIDPLRKVRINTANSIYSSDANNISNNLRLYINKRLGKKGRNLSLRMNMRFNKRDGESFQESSTHYYRIKSTQVVNGQQKDSLYIRNIYVDTPNKDYTISPQIRYTEPIADNTYLTASYNLGYSSNKSDRLIYDLSKTGWRLGSPLPDNYHSLIDSKQKQENITKNFVNSFELGLNINKEKYNFNTNLSLNPNKTNLKYTLGAYSIDTTRVVTNYSVRAEYTYKPNKATNISLEYRLRNSPPSIHSLLDVRKDEDPLNITVGNPNLKTTLNHSISFRTNWSNFKKGMFVSLFSTLDFTQNGVSAWEEYNATNGGRINRTDNINGNWSLSNHGSFNSNLFSDNFNLTFNMVSIYSNFSSYLYNPTTKTREINKNKHLSISPNLSLGYSNDWLDLNAESDFSFSSQRNKLREEYNESTYNISYGLIAIVKLPWKIRLQTSFNHYMQRGYKDERANTTEFIWSGSISKSFLKNNAAKVSIDFNDILNKRSLMQYDFTSTHRSTTFRKAVYSYVMVNFSYRLNIFGKVKKEPDFFDMIDNLQPGESIIIR
ncbi:MAG: outer membrane beta-barrel protein [Bacteroides sp.]|nr:outer membrane beta-barrel protein [Bacteroides sp.]